MAPHWYLLHRDLYKDGPVCLNGIPLPTKDYRDPDIAELASPKHTILSICDGVHKYLGPLKSDTPPQSSRVSQHYHSDLRSRGRLDHTSAEKYLEQFGALYCDLKEYPEFQLVDTPQGTKRPLVG